MMILRDTRLRLEETPETLETRFSGMDGTITTFSEHIIVAGYDWHVCGGGYYAAVYSKRDDGILDCETDMILSAWNGDELFKDDGHAIKWGIDQLMSEEV